MEFACSVLVVADQLLITRLKEICEVAITENCKPELSFYLPSLFICAYDVRICKHPRKKGKTWKFSLLGMKFIKSLENVSGLLRHYDCIS